MTTTITTPIYSREEILEKSEFSLVETSTDNIAGQLRFPPGLDRIAIRELVAEMLRQRGEILHQRCIGNVEATIGWSSLLFVASLAQNKVPIIGYRRTVKPATWNRCEMLPPPS